MTTIHADLQEFKGDIRLKTACSSIDDAYFDGLGWSITNVGSTYTFSGSESAAATIAASHALLVKELIQKGLLNGTF